MPLWEVKKRSTPSKSSGKTLKSRRNLTRFTYETTAFQGWRLCISKAGTTFTRYFSDKQYGGGQESLEAAEAALAEIKSIIGNAKLVKGKLSDASVRRAHKAMAAY